MYSSHYFQKVFWVDEKLTFKCCPLNDDQTTGNFDKTVLVNVKTVENIIKDIEDVNLLLDIQKGEILNQLNYNGSLTMREQ